MSQDVPYNFLSTDGLEDVSQAVSSAANLDEVLQLIAERSRVLLEVQEAFIFLANGDTLRLANATKPLKDEDVTFKVGTGLAGWVARQNRPLAIDDVRNDRRYRPAHFLNPDATTDIPIGMAFAPVRSGGQVLGVLAVLDVASEANQSDGPLATSSMAQLLPFLLVLADLVALSLDNLQILQRQNRRSQLIGLLHQISTTALDKTVQDILKDITNRISEATKAEKVDVMLHSKDTDEFVSLGSADSPLNSLQQELGFDHLALALSGRLLQVYQTGQPFITGNLTEADLPGNLIEKAHARSMLVVPLAVGEERLGVLLLLSTQPNFFDDDTLSFVGFISLRLGYAIRQEQLSQELALAERERIWQDERENFISIVAHDLRNAVAATNGNSQLALRRLARGDTEYARKAFQIITSKANQMQQLINDMVDVNNIEKGSFRLFITSVDLVSLLQEEVEANQALVSNHTLTFESQLAEIELAIDRQRIIQVFTNLLTNALRYSPEGGKVSVIIQPAPTQADSELSDLPQVVMVTVADEGIGISSDDQLYIFDRMFRGEGANLANGSGLGLYISREIIRQHGGRLWVESEVGQGSRFHITLPQSRTISPS